jgi:hypothetical protein
MMKKMALALPFTLLLSSCEMVPQEPEAIKQMSLCEKVQALLKEHDNRFKALRTSSPTRSRSIVVWDARYHLVGNNCQIWEWGKGNANYVCGLSTPNKDMAIERFNKAKEETRQCLDQTWELEERPRKIGNGLKATFSLPGGNTVAAVHAVETRGVFKSEWSTYFTVGNRNDEI